MNSKFKEIIQREIKIRLNSNFGGNYINRMGDVNEKLYSLYGSREEELLLALIDFYISNYNFENYENFIMRLLNFPNNKGFNPKLILKYLLNGKLPLNYDFRPNFLYEIIRKIKSKELINKLIENSPEKFNLYDLGRIIMAGKPFIEDEELIYLFKEKFLKTNSNLEIFTVLENFLNEKTPEPLLKIFIDKISSWPLDIQVAFKNQSELPTKYFDKISAIKDYTIIGSPQGEKKLMIIRNPNERLYGYVNGEGKVIIPPLFDEVSNVTSDGKIRVSSDSDRGDIKAGIYHIDEDGKIIKILKQF